MPLGVTVSAPREPGRAPDLRWGYFAHSQIMTLPVMLRHYARIGLNVIDYSIEELV